MSASAWSPLRHPVFRALWVVTIISNVGTWMQNVAAAWLMTSLSQSSVMVALVQTATSLPVFFLALPAGALADVVDRRRLLLLTQSWMLLMAMMLGALTLLNLTTPWTLLLLTFSLGIGAATNAPAWQSCMPELVPREDLPGAVALGSVGFNIARAVGPALGGLVIAAAGPGGAFVLNAISFVGVLAVLYRWQHTREQNALPAERFVGAIRAGLRYARHAPELQAVLVRAGAFILCGAALWALLPLRSKNELGYGATGYGALLGCLGAGALIGAGVLPALRSRLANDAMISCTSLLFGVANLGPSSVRWRIIDVYSQSPANPIFRVASQGGQRVGGQAGPGRVHGGGAPLPVDQARRQLARSGDAAHVAPVARRPDQALDQVVAEAGQPGAGGHRRGHGIDSI